MESETTAALLLLVAAILCVYKEKYNVLLSFFLCWYAIIFFVFLWLDGESGWACQSLLFVVLFRGKELTIICIPTHVFLSIASVVKWYV